MYATLRLQRFSGQHRYDAVKKLALATLFAVVLALLVLNIWGYLTLANWRRRRIRSATPTPTAL